MSKLAQPPRTAITKRLKRAAGHLKGTLDMIDKEKPCLALAQQLAAVEAAVTAARQLVVREQMHQSLAAADADGATRRQLQALARFL